ELHDASRDALPRWTRRSTDEDTVITKNRVPPAFPPCFPWWCFSPGSIIVQRVVECAPDHAHLVDRAAARRRPVRQQHVVAIARGVDPQRRSGEPDVAERRPGHSYAARGSGEHPVPAERAGASRYGAPPCELGDERGKKRKRRRRAVCGVENGRRER